jgi:hypothetical protein
MIAKGTLREILNKQDPMGIFFGDNTDEYGAEIESIMQVITKNPTQEELTEDIWLIFQAYFGKIEAGAKEKYSAAAKEILARIN